MPNISGMDLLERIVEWDSAVDVVLFSGEGSTGRAVEAVQKGASDYLSKPISISLLRERIGTLIAQARSRIRSNQLADEMRNTSRFGEMIGGSPLMLEVYSRIRRIGPHFRIASITGATGTGKELVARTLHQFSPVSNKPFIVCNCAAIVDNLFESELGTESPVKRYVTFTQHLARRAPMSQAVCLGRFLRSLGVLDLRWSPYRPGLRSF
jgi:DNA-binding NtrC family response regulator